MLDIAHCERMDEAFAILLRDLSGTWPEQDIEYVREEVGHREYGDALENLIALGLKNGIGFSADQARKVEAIGVAVGIEDSPFLAQLRQPISGASHS